MLRGNPALGMQKTYFRLLAYYQEKNTVRHSTAVHNSSTSFTRTVQSNMTGFYFSPIYYLSFFSCYSISLFLLEEMIGMICLLTRDNVTKTMSYWPSIFGTGGSVVFHAPRPSGDWRLFRICHCN
jgi:hypothetical protein